MRAGPILSCPLSLNHLVEQDQKPTPKTYPRRIKGVLSQPCLSILQGAAEEFTFSTEFPQNGSGGPWKVGPKRGENKNLKVLLTHTEDVERETMANRFVNQLVRQAIESDMARKRNSSTTFTLRWSQKGCTLMLSLSGSTF